MSSVEHSEVICSLSPVLLHGPIFPVWLLHSSCGPRWIEVSWAGSKTAKCSFNAESGTWCFYQHVAKGFPQSQACMVAFLKLEDSSGFWMLWEFLSFPGRVLPCPASEAWLKAEEWRVPPSPSCDFKMYLLQLSAFSISSCWEACVGTFFWVMCCWILSFYCILGALSLWTSELLQILKILSIDFCSFGRSCICRKIARTHSRFLYVKDVHSKATLNCLKHNRELKCSIKNQLSTLAYSPVSSPAGWSCVGSYGWSF